MKRISGSDSSIFTPRILAAFILCSLAMILGMFSLVAKPPIETKGANTRMRPDLATVLSLSGRNANRLLPGVPLPSSTRFSANARGDWLNRSRAAGFPGFAGMPPGTVSGTNSLGDPVFDNRERARQSYLNLYELIERSEPGGALTFEELPDSIAGNNGSSKSEGPTAFF